MNKFLSQLLYPKKVIVGLDIGSSYIKIMEVEGDSLENAKLSHYAIEPIPEHLNGYLNSNEEKLESIAEFAEIVKRCWKKAGIKSKYVSLCLPNSSIITKKIISPIFDEDEMKLHLENEIVKYLPNGITTNEIALEYAVQDIESDEATEYNILLLAAKKNKIEEKIAIVEAAGLIPIILDVEQYAMQNMLRLMKGEDFNKKTYLLLDCASTNLKMLVYRNGEIIATRDAPMGGVNLIQNVMNTLKVSFSDAERLIIESDENNIDYKIVEKNFINSYVNEFISVFRYFKSSTTVPDIDEVILTGGLAGLPFLEEAFKYAIIEHKETHIKTEPYIARPLHTIPKGENMSLNKFLKDEPSLFLVTALALRHFLRQF